MSRRSLPANAFVITQRLRGAGAFKHVMHEQDILRGVDQKCLLWPVRQAGGIVLVLQFETQRGLRQKEYAVELTAAQQEVVDDWLSKANS